MFKCMVLTLSVAWTLGACGIYGISGQTEVKKYVSSPKYTTLPGMARGILRADFGKDLQSDGGTAPSDAFGFTSGQGKERLVYIPCNSPSEKCEALTVFVGAEGKQRKRFASVALLTTHTAPSGLKEKNRYRLVDAEVNDGLGSPASEFFVATKIVPRDGTDYFPRLDPIVEKAKAGFDKQLEDNRTKIGQWIDKARAAAIGSKPGTGPREATTRLFITWVADKELVIINMHSLITDGDYHYSSGVGKKGSSLMQIRYGTQFGVKIHTHFTINRKGTVTESPIEWEIIKIELPPPS